MLLGVYTVHTMNKALDHGHNSAEGCSQPGRERGGRGEERSTMGAGSTRCSLVAEYCYGSCVPDDMIGATVRNSERDEVV